ncbi:hypothetical protein [Tengunoibacter tsumagoiensis]|uniref:hypothetical protein n=1 Tax=Tengunoibacter tsumagoiensis TaxID=2014871 RepID=UPI000F81D6D3|nr:hypothetical protein [Tengunoibacter tsumagoiensis]
MAIIRPVNHSPAGGYTYDDSKHPHAVTAAANGYTASYDLAGNMICRAPTSATTCTGTQTGQQLGYDPEGRLSTWQDKPNSPSSTAKYLYDGEGNRVVAQTTSGSNTTTTTYIGNSAEVQQTTGPSMQTRPVLA